MSDLPTRVQSAADRLLRASLAATPGTWMAVPVRYATDDDPMAPTHWEVAAEARGLPGVFEDVVTHQTYEGGGIHHQPDAEWITLAQPGVGELLARWLHVIAARMRDFQAAGMDPSSMADERLMALINKINNLEIFGVSR